MFERLFELGEVPEALKVRIFDLGIIEHEHNGRAANNVVWNDATLEDAVI